jgi:hypothetical protein
VIATLDALVGEVVVVNVGSAQQGLSRLDVIGPLRQSSSGTSDAVFAIGDACYLTLDGADFVSADLSTQDGNEYFQLTIELRTATLLIGDLELVGLTLFGS